MNILDHIYIAHWNKLSERKIILCEGLSSNGIFSVEWVENYEAEKLDVKDIENEYPFIFGTNPMGRLLKKSEISLVLKHCWIIKDAFENKYSSVLVLEDDALIPPDFMANLENYMSQLPDLWDIFWLGTCCNIHAQFVSGCNIYPGPRSRCTHAFVLNQSGIAKIVQSLYLVNDGADFFYNKLIESHDLLSFWAEPPLVYQNQQFKTTIQDSNI